MNATPHTTSPYAGALPTTGMHDAIDTSPASVRRMEHLASADADSATRGSWYPAAMTRSVYAMRDQWMQFEMTGDHECRKRAQQHAERVSYLICLRLAA
jgi:hypothetical protein